MRVALTKSGGFKLAATAFFTMLVVGVVMSRIEGKNVQETSQVMIMVGWVVGNYCAIQAWPKAAKLTATYACYGAAIASVIGVLLIGLGVIIEMSKGSPMGMYIAGLISILGGFAMFLFGMSILSAVKK